MQVSNTKKCVRCNLTQDLSCFYNHSKTLDGKGSYCKDCCNSVVQEHQQSKKGLVSKIYSSQTSSSKRRGHSRPEYSIQELRRWLFSQPNFDNLYNIWVDSNYSKDYIPSIDRLNDDVGYSFDNIKLTFWKEHDEDAHRKCSKPVEQKYRNGSCVRTYKSITEASRITGLNSSTISNCCNSKKITTGGYYWSFI